MRSAVREALRFCLPQTAIPAALCRKYALSPLGEAYRRIHAPETFAQKDGAAERIALEEYFLLLSAFKLLKGSKEDARAFRYSCTAADVADFARRFPYELTAGQKGAVNEIYENLKCPQRMNRLLQGDVGCGKTAVALCAVFMAVKSGHQAMMLAPTEVLAEQNFAPRAEVSARVPRRAPDRAPPPRRRSAKQSARSPRGSCASSAARMRCCRRT